jgi:7-cyano-7-deazaguanine synthase
LEKVVRSIVLLSGGLDSAVALYWALDKGYEVETLTFDYFRRSQKEIEACLKISKFAMCPNRRIELAFLKEIDDDKKINRNTGLTSVESAYIPGRNLIFYGIAVSFAEVADARYIVGGHNKNDAENFPDSSLEFFKLFNQAASLGKFTGSKTGKVVLPFARLDKSEVLRLGARLGVPFELTWSCYKSGNKPCQKCLSCKLRAESFEKAGISDPLLNS